MSENFTGGCLCGALRYHATGAPTNTGHCYCADCRKASGSGFIPFMGFKRDAVTFTGDVASTRSPAASGGDAVRNRCARCGSLVFGGELDRSDSFTIYAGSLDDPRQFTPRIAIFTQDCPPWVAIPPGLKIIEVVPRTRNAPGSP